MDAEHQNAMYSPDFVRRVQERRRAEAEQLALATRLERESKAAKSEAEIVQERLDRIEALKASIAPTDSGLVVTRKVVACIGDLHGIERHLLTAPTNGRRRQGVAIEKARIEAILLVHDLRPHYSANQIGRLFNRNHSSILAVLWRYGGVPKYQGSGPRPTEAAKCA